MTSGTIEQGNEMVWAAPLSTQTKLGTYFDVSIISNDYNLENFVTQNAFWPDYMTQKITPMSRLTAFTDYTDGYALEVILRAPIQNEIPAESYTGFCIFVSPLYAECVTCFCDNNASGNACTEDEL